MKAIRSLALAGLVTAAGCGEAGLSTRLPWQSAPREAQAASSPVRGIVSELPSLWERQTSGFQLAPGIEYNSMSMTDRNGNETDVELVGFGLTNYVNPVPVDAGPIFLESLLSQSSWWAVFVGPATMETDTDKYSGHYARVEAVAVGTNRLGARVGYTYSDTMAHDIELAAAQLAVFYDYVSGGRVSAWIADEDLEVVVLVPLASSTIAWGADWTHVFEFGGGGALGVRYSVGRREYSYGAPQPNEHNELGCIFYPTKEVGFSVGGAWDRGDREEADALTVGIRFDLEQVGFLAEFTRRDRSEPTEGSDDGVTVKLEMRF